MGRPSRIGKSSELVASLLQSPKGRVHFRVVSNGIDRKSMDWLLITVRTDDEMIVNWPKLFAVKAYPQAGNDE